MVLCVIVIAGQDIPSLLSLNWSHMAMTYFSVVLVLVLYLGFKFVNHTKIVRLKDMDVSGAESAR